MVLDGAYARVSEVTHGGISELTIRGLLKQSKVELLDPFEQFRNEPLEHFFFFEESLENLLSDPLKDCLKKSPEGFLNNIGENFC